MRRMFSEKQIEKIIDDNVVADLVGKDISVEGITSKGIANTGSLGNIGDVAISGNLSVQGEGKGKGSFRYLDVEKAVELEMEVSNLGGRTFTKRYCKALVSAGVMYLIISGVFSNETESSISSGSPKLSIDNIPEEIGSRIICFNGESVAEGSSTSQICGITLRRGNTLDTVNQRYLFRDGQNKISLNLQVSALEPSATEQTEARTFICLF